MLKKAFFRVQIPQNVSLFVIMTILDMPRVQNPGIIPFLSCTSVRIPTLRAHSEAVTIETEKPVSTEAARKVLIPPPTTKVIRFLYAYDFSNSISLTWSLF